MTRSTAIALALAFVALMAFGEPAVRGVWVYHQMEALR